MTAVQTREIVHIASLYRTVSDLAMLVVAGSNLYRSSREMKGVYERRYVTGRRTARSLDSTFHTFFECEKLKEDRRGLE